MKKKTAFVFIGLGYLIYLIKLLRKLITDGQGENGNGGEKEELFEEDNNGGGRNCYEKIKIKGRRN